VGDRAARPRRQRRRAALAAAGHATRQSLEIYSRLGLADAQQRYDDVIGDFPSDQHDHARLRLVTRFLPAPDYR